MLDNHRNFLLPRLSTSVLYQICCNDKAYYSTGHNRKKHDSIELKRNAQLMSIHEASNICISFKTDNKYMR
jgi:hypothetical protein